MFPEHLNQLYLDVATVMPSTTQNMYLIIPAFFEFFQDCSLPFLKLVLAEKILDQRIDEFFPEHLND